MVTERRISVNVKHGCFVNPAGRPEMFDTVSNNPHADTMLLRQQISQEKNTFYPSSPENGTNNIAQDRITLSADNDPVLTYSGSMTLNTDGNVRYDMLRGIVANMLKEQGINFKVATGDREIDISAVTPEEAQQLTSDDGYFGVDKTSERIFQLAVSVAGGDPGRIDAIKEGIDKGYQEALKVFDGKLPDISHDTYNAVMEKLDNWVNESQTTE